MKKYFLVFFIISVALLNFGEVCSNIQDSTNKSSNSCEFIEYNGEEDCEVINTNSNLMTPKGFPIIILEGNPTFKRVFNIWKPPVKA